MSHNYTQDIRRVANKKQGRSSVRGKGMGSTGAHKANPAFRNSAVSMLNSDLRPISGPARELDRLPFRTTDGVSSIHSNTFYKENSP